MNNNTANLRTGSTLKTPNWVFDSKTSSFVQDKNSSEKSSKQGRQHQELLSLNDDQFGPQIDLEHHVTSFFHYTPGH
jgi:hypothetical protein